MSDENVRYFEAFPTWLRSLADDARAMAEILDDPRTPEASRRALAAGLNYLFKALDLIPDGIDDIGFLDDAFVLRVAAKQALSYEGARAVDKGDALDRLGNEARMVEGFLGADYPRLSAYVKSLWTSTVRGRSVEDLATKAEVRAALVSDVRAFAAGYTTPSFTREERTLVKLKSFLGAKLPPA